MACLAYAARFRKDWLAGFLQIGRDACKRRVPYAYVFPAGQKDPGALNELLKVLMDGQVEIHKAMEEFDINGVIYSSGSYVVKLAQPYGPYAKTLLEVQNYPDLRLYPGGPPRLPYDVTGHTLPLMMGVKTILAQNEFKANLERVHDLKTTRSRKNIRESDKWIALSPNTNRTFKIVNSLLEDSIDVFRTAVGFRHEGRYIVPGTYLIEIKP